MNNFWKKNNLFILIVFFFLSSCGPKDKEGIANADSRISYFKNMQSNVSGYKTQGFNPLTIDIVKKTDCFRFTYNKDSSLKELAFVIKGRLEDSYTFGFARRVFSYTDSTITYIQYDKNGKKIPLSRANGASTAFAKQIIISAGIPFGERGLDFNNDPLRNFTEKRFECDSLGRIIWEQNINDFGKVLDISRREGIFYRNYEYTEDNLVKSTSFYEIQEKKRSLSGIHKVLYEYNGAGNIIKNSFLDENNQMRPEPGTGIAYRIMKYNDMGNMTEQSFYDLKGNLVQGASGYALQLNEYDKYSNNTQSSYFGADKKPAINKEIAAFIEKLTYDDKGDLVLNEFFNIDEKLITSAVLGYAYKALEFNDSGQISREAYYDKDNKAIIFKGLGAHVKWSEYNEDGLLISTKFENADNELFLHPACNCAGIQFIHDSLGNVIEETYIDTKGSIVANGKNGIAQRKYIFNKYGFVELTQYFDKQGKEITIQGSQPLQ